MRTPWLNSFEEHLLRAWKSVKSSTFPDCLSEFVRVMTSLALFAIDKHVLVIGISSQSRTNIKSGLHNSFYQLITFISFIELCLPFHTLMTLGFSFVGLNAFSGNTSRLSVESFSEKACKENPDQLILLVLTLKLHRFRWNSLTPSHTRTGTPHLPSDGASGAATNVGPPQRLWYPSPLHCVRAVIGMNKVLQVKWKLNKVSH